jgi:hypothetical protein
MRFMLDSLGRSSTWLDHKQPTVGALPHTAGDLETFVRARSAIRARIAKTGQAGTGTRETGQAGARKPKQTR